MVRMAWQHTVQNLGAPLLPCVTLVGRIEIPDRHQLKRMEDRRLVVVRMPLANLTERLLVSFRSRSMGKRLRILVEYGEGLNVIALTLSLGAHRDRTLERCCALFQLIG